MSTLRAPRPSSARSTRRVAVLFAAVTAGLSPAGCNILAGIDEGTLVSASPPDAGDAGLATDATTDGRSQGSGRDSGHDSGRDATREGGHDAGRDAPRDVTPETAAGPDAGVDSPLGHDAGSPHDAARDTPASSKLYACTPATAVTLDNLSRDAGTREYGAGLWVAAVASSPGFSVFAQLGSVQGYLGYATGADAGIVKGFGDLVDVEVVTDINGNAAIDVLTWFPEGAVALQAFDGTSAVHLSTTGGSSPAVNGVSAAGGRIADGIAHAFIGEVALLVTNGDGSRSLSYAIAPFGGLISATSDHVYTSSSSLAFPPGSAMLVAPSASGATFYTLLTGVPDAGANGTLTVFADDYLLGDASEALNNARMAQAIQPPAAGGALLGARMSVESPGQAILVAAEARSGGGYVPCGATFNPAHGFPSTLCGSGFTVEGELPDAGAPFANPAFTSAWSGTSDDLLVVAPGSSGPAVSLLWLSATGQADAVLDIPATNPVKIAAAQFGPSGAGGSRTIYVAWVESVASGDVLRASTVSCVPP